MVTWETLRAVVQAACLEPESGEGNITRSQPLKDSAVRGEPVTQQLGFVSSDNGGEVLYLARIGQLIGQADGI